MAHNGQPQVAGAEGLAQVHVPFSLHDLSQIEAKLGSFSSNPTHYIKQFTQLTRSYALTWKDIYVVLGSTTTLEERQAIWTAARAQADQRHFANPSPERPPGAEAVPDTDPDWDYQETRGRELRVRYMVECLLDGMEATSNKVVNFLKLDEITQGPDENPAMFLNRLTEALTQYTRLAPDAPAGAVTLASCFISQSAPDIRKKLAKANKGPQTPIRDLTPPVFRLGPSFPCPSPTFEDLSQSSTASWDRAYWCLLVPTSSPCNTPILPVRKASGAYQLVQDLRLINEAVVPTHPSRWITLHEKLVLPEQQAITIIKQIHDTLHIGPRALLTFLSLLFSPLHLRQAIQTVHRSCLTCATISPQGGLRPPQETHQLRGHLPGQDWQITQQVAAALNITWHLHIPYRPQSSGKVERANGVLKAHLAKLASEVRLSWVDLLPLAPTRIRTTPHSKTGSKK
ncbi:uncharacterized protein [Odocoileus virginianus]|uniref:Integrase catalytic domain-containing protein n=1 Tax=Odocoileus virginianus TaxID=9874 RepID=A0ABM4H3X3_ODOVR